MRLILLNDKGFMKMKKGQLTKNLWLFTGVELEGFEPSSTPEDHMFSTCIVLLDCRDKSGAKQPNLTLALLISPADQSILPANFELPAPRYRVGTKYKTARETSRPGI